jgi:membrane-associated phospholipid phosphatase
MTPDLLDLPLFWHLLTRLGEATILLPAALLALLMLLRRSATRPVAVWWLVLLMGSTLLTTASKLAFMGWGLGSPAFNFTGISGHAMFAAAIYPLLLATLASSASPNAQRLAVALGFAVALMIGISRVKVGAHSGTEVVAGLLLGGAVSIAVLALTRLPRAVMSPIIPALVAVWLMITPVHAPQLKTHSWVTQLALRLSGHATPYTRVDLLHTGARQGGSGSNAGHAKSTPL